LSKYGSIPNVGWVDAIAEKGGTDWSRVSEQGVFDFERLEVKVERRNLSSQRQRRTEPSPVCRSFERSTGSL
jgi:hypothetical protein